MSVIGKFDVEDISKIFLDMGQVLVIVDNRRGDEKQKRLNEIGVLKDVFAFLQQCFVVFEKPNQRPASNREDSEIDGQKLAVFLAP